jgi:hypothetical protein
MSSISAIGGLILVIDEKPIIKKGLDRALISICITVGEGIVTFLKCL